MLEVHSLFDAALAFSVGCRGCLSVELVVVNGVKGAGCFLATNGCPSSLRLLGFCWHADPAQAPLAATGTLGEIDRWIKGLDDNGALEPSASADPESAALGHENVVDVEFNFESVGFEPNQEDGSVD